MNAKSYRCNRCSDESYESKTAVLAAGTQLGKETFPEETALCARCLLRALSDMRFKPGEPHNQRFKSYGIADLRDITDQEEPVQDAVVSQFLKTCRELIAADDIDGVIAADAALHLFRYYIVLPHQRPVVDELIAVARSKSAVWAPREIDRVADAVLTMRGRDRDAQERTLRRFVWACRLLLDADNVDSWRVVYAKTRLCQPMLSAEAFKDASLHDLRHSFLVLMEEASILTQEDRWTQEKKDRVANERAAEAEWARKAAAAKDGLTSP